MRFDDLVRHARVRAVRGRRANRPGGANGGSLLRNLQGASAAPLIGAAGRKGPRRGTAGVSELHANSIRADIDARANVAYALSWRARGLLERHRGINLCSGDCFVKLGVTP